LLYVRIFVHILSLMLALMLVFILCLYPFVTFIITRRHHLTHKTIRHRLYRQLTDAVFGRMDWQASGRTDEILKNFTTENERLIQEEKKIRQRKHIRDASLRFVVGMIVIAMMVWTDLQT